MRYPTYPAYKDSGVAWLGAVPGHWPLVSLGYRYDVQLGKMLDEKRIAGTHLAPYLRNVDVQWDSINATNLPEMDFSHDDRQKYRLIAGDLLVCEGGEVGRCAIWEGAIDECYYQKALHRLRPRKPCEDNPRFLYYLISMAAIQGRFSVGSNISTIEHLPAEKLRRYRFPFPPVVEQAAIAAFLDRETAKIAALVAKQERLIALLGEKRQALIAHAVTKGLDPAAPMQDSGVPWLGAIPAHWGVAALGYRYEVQLGKMLDEKRILGRHLAPYLRNVDVQWDTINISTLPQMDFDEDDKRKFRLMYGDLLVCEGGEVGRAAIWTSPIDECYYQKALHRLRPKLVASDHSRFLFFVLYAAAKQGRFSAGGNVSTIEHLTAEKLRRYRFAFPVIREQKQIADYLDRETAKIDTLITKAQQAIALMREHRTSLIASAVTGKIDVRGAVGAGDGETVAVAAEAGALAGVAE